METDKEQLYHEVFAQTEKSEKRLGRKKARMKEVVAQLQKLNDEKEALTKEIETISMANAASTYTNLEKHFQKLGIDITDKDTFEKIFQVIADSFERKKVDETESVDGQSVDSKEVANP